MNKIKNYFKSLALTNFKDFIIFELFFTFIVYALIWIYGITGCMIIGPIYSGIAIYQFIVSFISLLNFFNFTEEQREHINPKF